MNWEDIEEIAQIEHNCKINRSEADVYLAKALLELKKRLER
jgi:hypothetical protein